jgi:hypothetical protein
VIDVAPDDLMATYEGEVRKQFDVKVKGEAAQLEKDISETERALGATLTALAALPDPIKSLDATPMSRLERETMATGTLLRLQRIERQLSGKSSGAIADLYESGDDLVRWTIEDQSRRAWPDIQRATVPDTVGEMRLQKAITAAQHARVEKEYGPLLAAQARIAKVSKSATLRMLFEHLRTRGIATRPQRRVVRLRP